MADAQVDSSAKPNLGPDRGDLSPRWYRENPAKKNIRQRTYYLRHREERLAVMRLINYGCTARQFDAMFAAQDGKCAICRSLETTTHKGRLRKLSVDHDHSTGKIRALLCGACNTGLGSFEYNPNVLEAAITYLQNHVSSGRIP